MFKFAHFFSPISLSRPRHVDDAPVDRKPIVFVKLIKPSRALEHRTPFKPFD